MEQIPQSSNSNGGFSDPNSHNVGHFWKCAYLIGNLKARWEGCHSSVSVLNMKLLLGCFLLPLLLMLS